MSKELTPLNNCYCVQLQANYNDAIKLSDEELDAKLNEYPEAKRMCAALVLLVEQRVNSTDYVDMDDWESDVFSVIETAIEAKNQ